MQVIIDSRTSHFPHVQALAASLSLAKLLNQRHVMHGGWNHHQPMVCYKLFDGHGLPPCSQTIDAAFLWDALPTPASVVPLGPRSHLRLCPCLLHTPWVS